VIGPAAPGPAGRSARILWQVARARNLLAERLTAERFRGEKVLDGSAAETTISGDLAPYAIERGDAIASVVKDAVTLGSVLAKEPPTEAEQWTAVGLLRRHLNPWDFAFLFATLRARGVAARFEQFAGGPLTAYRMLTASVAHIRTAAPITPVGEPGLVDGLHDARVSGVVERVDPVADLVDCELASLGQGVADVSEGGLDHYVHGLQQQVRLKTCS
jgi:hypothetical protein